MQTTAQEIEFTRVNSDVNGNPRYVCHFLNLVNEEDRKRVGTDLGYLSALYNIALSRAARFGGRKFHNKQYGGGIVFSSYNTREESELIQKAARTTYVSFFESADGEITAVFPYQEAQPGFLNCYAHNGQHATCTDVWLNTQRKLQTGKKKDRSKYADLQKELISIGYVLEII